MSLLAVNAEPAAIPPARRWLKAATLAAALLCCVAAARLWPATPEPFETRTFSSLSELPNLREEESPDAAEPPRIFGFMGHTVRSLEIDAEPGAAGPLERVRLYWLAPQSYWIPWVEADPKRFASAFEPLEDGDSQIRKSVQHAAVTWDADRVRLRFHLREPALWLKLVFPPTVKLKVVGLRVVTENAACPWGLPRWLPLLAKIGLLGLAAWATLGLARQLWPALPQAELKRLALFALGAMLALTAMLLPPFQGPDENRHWFAALTLYGRSEEKEPILFRLPEIVGALPSRWKADVPAHPDLLRWNGAPPSRGDHDSVGYGSKLTYPFVGAVALFFPTVSTLPEALCFYGLCRLLPVLCWAPLLFFLERRGWLTWTLLTFLSFPLVLQQSVVVSSDTLTLLGTLGAGALFLVCRKDGGWRPLLLLWLVALAVTLGKPGTPLLLLPLFLLPWRKIPLKWLTLPLGLAAIVGLGWLVLNYGLRLVEASRGDEGGKLKGRLEYVMRPEGGAVFLRNVVHRFTWGADAFDEWFQPLGWLDTPISDWHRALLYAALLLALAADAAERGRSWLKALKSRPGELAALWGLVLVHAAALILAYTLVMFLAHTQTEKGDTAMYGVQIRYFYPAVLVACLIPLGLKNEGMPPPTLVGAAGLGAALLPTLLFVFLLARGVALAVDLLVRYFG